MEHRDIFILDDIIEYCDKIASYLADFKVDHNLFLSEPRHQDICAFYCLQIGEDANSLSDKFRDSHPEMDWRGIIGLRHNIAHEYGGIDAGILWDVVNEEVPQLRDFCERIIS